MRIRQISADQGPSIEGLTPFLIAITICAPLWGITISQGAAYYRKYKQDKLYLKVLVGTCITTQLFTLVYTVYFWMIICRSPPNYSFLGVLKNSLVVVPAYMTYFLIAVVQWFYAMRVWSISGKKLWLVFPILVFSLAQLVGGFALVGHMTSANTITAVYSHFNHISGGIELGSSMACDILISASLWWYLRKTRGTVFFERTRTALDVLILQAIEIGLLTSVTTLVNIVTWLALPETDFTWAIFHFSLGKLYVNSMLVLLNSRNKIQRNLASWSGEQDFDMGTGSENVER